MPDPDEVLGVFEGYKNRFFRDSQSWCENLMSQNDKEFKKSFHGTFGDHCNR